MLLGTLGRSSLCEVEHQTSCVTVSQLTSPAAAALLSVGSDFHSCFTSTSTVIDVTAGVFAQLSMTKLVTGHEEILGHRQLDFPLSLPNPLFNWLKVYVTTQV